MVRYGRNKKNNRNSVLFTFRSAGGLVFFGLSRCSEGDTFDRARGLDIAKGRADKVFARAEAGDSVVGQAADLQRDTTAGFVSVTEVPLLLNWFRSLNK